MRAVLITEFGPPSILVVEEIPDPTPGLGEVVIEVAAVSINFPDIMVVEAAYQNLPPRLFSPGKESAGRVIAVGDAVDRVTVGQRALTLVEYGGYAEKLVVPEDLVMALPDGMSYEEAAACGLVYSTAHFGLLRRAQLKHGETVLITGAGGGVGSAGVQLAKAWGARVIALAQDDAKGDLARQQGADVVVTSRPETVRDDLLAATDGRGVDVVLEMLGGEFSEPDHPRQRVGGSDRHCGIRLRRPESNQSRPPDGQEHQHHRIAEQRLPRPRRGTDAQHDGRGLRLLRPGQGQCRDRHHLSAREGQ
jgi:NADPH:quinone reductase